MLRFLILAALCGWSSGFLAMPPMPDERIIGGAYAAIAAHPHQVSVQLYGYHHCGGSIISASWVVTAATCIDRSLSVLAYTIMVGNADIYLGTKYSVRRVVIHPKFQNLGVDYNIALMEISPPIAFSVSTKPIQLATLEIAANSIVNVTGWGSLTLGGTGGDPIFSTQLMQVSIPIMDRQVCAKFFGSVHPNIICAGPDRINACEGDEGGPMSANGVLYGVVSFVTGCGRPGYPGMYSNVSYFRPWIRNVTGI